MKTRQLLQALALAGTFLLATPGAAATFLISDVTNWIGPAAGPGINQAVLVLDWADAQPAWAWGYRWDASQSKTGADLLTAVLGVESRLTATVSGAGFVSNVGWSGTRFQGDYNPGTGQYWNYFVNKCHSHYNH